MRELAERAGISKSTAHRLLQGISEPLGRRARFKLSDDPLFTARVREVVGLYLNAPGYAFALCVGDSLNAPASIVGTALTARGSVRGVGGETGDAPMALPVALDLSLASPADRFKASARHRDFLYFLEKLDTAVPAAFDVYVIEAYESYKHRKVRDWLTERPRFHMSNIYDSSVWLKQLECWLRVIGGRVAGSRGFRRLIDGVVVGAEQFLQTGHERQRPFIWTAEPDSLRERLGLAGQVAPSGGRR